MVLPCASSSFDLNELQNSAQVNSWRKCLLIPQVLADLAPMCSLYHCFLGVSNQHTVSSLSAYFFYLQADGNL